jgi:hypothetical protein
MGTLCFAHPTGRGFFRATACQTQALSLLRKGVFEIEIAIEIEIDTLCSLNKGVFLSIVVSMIMKWKGIQGRYYASFLEHFTKPFKN